MKLSITTRTFLAGIFLLSINQISVAETKYKTSFIAKTDFQTIDWNGGKATVGTLKGILETYGSTISFTWLRAARERGTRVNVEAFASDLLFAGEACGELDEGSSATLRHRGHRLSCPRPSSRTAAQR